VRAHQGELHLLQVLAADVGVGQGAEARGDAVHHLVLVDRVGHHGAAGRHPGRDVVAELRSGQAAGHRHQVVEDEGFAGDRHCPHGGQPSGAGRRRGGSAPGLRAAARDLSALVATRAIGYGLPRTTT
jgi:hypothetical protein